MKECSNCNVIKPLKDFHKHKGRKLGVTEMCKPCRNVSIVENRYNLKQGEYEKMLKSQNNKCAICEKTSTEEGKNLAVDHCHTTGVVRGLLCINCNNGLGRFKDDIKLLEKSISYLKERN